MVPSTPARPDDPPALDTGSRRPAWRAIVAICALSALVGASALLVPSGHLEPALLRYALSQSLDGEASPQGLAQMLLAVRLGGATALAAAFGGLLLVFLGRWLDSPPEPWTEPAAREPAGAAESAGLAVISGVALAARLPSLAASLTYDEAMTVLSFVHPGAPLRSLVEFQTLNNHPLFSVLAGLGAATFGWTEWAFRLPSLVASLGSVVVAHAVGRRLGGRVSGLTCAALVALAPPLVLYAGQARGYSLLVLWSLLSALALLRAAERPTRRRWAAWVAVGVLGTWTHLFMVIAMLGEAAGLLVVAAWRRARGGSGATGAQAVLGLVAWALLSVTVYAPVLHRVVFEIVGFTLVPRAFAEYWSPAPRGAPRAGVVLLSGEWPGLVGEPTAFAAVVLGCALGGAWAASRRLRPDVPAAMLGPLVAVGAALVLLHGRDFAPGRFFVEVLPLTLVLAGTGLAAVARASVPVAGALAVSVLVLQGRGLAALHEAPESGLRELAGHLVRERRAGDVVAGDWSVQPVLRYYVPDPPLRPTPPFPDHPGARLLYLCRMECQPWRLHPDLETARELVRVQEGMLPYRLLAFPPP